MRVTGWNKIHLTPARDGRASRCLGNNTNNDRVEEDPANTTKPFRRKAATGMEILTNCD